MTPRVDAVVFDVLETLLDLHPIAERVVEVGQRPEVLGAFFMRFQRDAMALTLAGDVADYEVVTCDTVGVWKPAPQVYRHAAQALGCEVDRTALVAVHAWDCHGAKKVGALAGWCSRLEGEPGDVFLPADVRGEDLVEVAGGLLAL